jgi:hypothetical protein
MSKAMHRTDSSGPTGFTPPTPSTQEQGHGWKTGSDMPDAEHGNDSFSGVPNSPPISMDMAATAPSSAGIELGALGRFSLFTHVY